MEISCYRLKASACKSVTSIVLFEHEAHKFIANSFYVEGKHLSIETMRQEFHL